jgi:hypothetical protein
MTTGRRIAEALDVSEDGIHAFDETNGKAAVVAAYTVGDNSPLVQAAIQFRPPGSPIWFIRVDPRFTGDGPSYLIPSETAARFTPLVVPRVPSEAELSSEGALFKDQALRVAAELDESDLTYWNTARTTDLTDAVRGAPSVLGGFLGGVAGFGVRSVTALVGGAAGAFYGALPAWVQIGLPVLVIGAGVAGAVAVARKVPSIKIGS